MLRVHENTIRNRIRAAEALLGTSLMNRRTELQVALRLERVLNAAARRDGHGTGGVTEAEAIPSGIWWGRHWAEVRWQAQLARLVVDPVFRGVGVPRGDGRPVVLIPGFMAGDFTLGVLGDWLDRIGYDATAPGCASTSTASTAAWSASRIWSARCTSGRAGGSR